MTDYDSDPRLAFLKEVIASVCSNGDSDGLAQSILAVVDRTLPRAVADETRDPRIGDLKAVVQYRARLSPNWTTMAAFDSALMAEHYCIDCANANKKHWEYQWFEIKKDNPDV